MILRLQNPLFFSAFTALLAFVQSAQANDLLYGKSAQIRANAKCAVYGPGFAAAQGSDTCIWVGGHVRMQFGSRDSGSSNNGWASGGTVPAAMRVQDSAELNTIARDMSAGGLPSVSKGHLRPQNGDVTGSIEAR
jgi:hypothetical protein